MQSTSTQSGTSLFTAEPGVHCLVGTALSDNRTGAHSCKASGDQQSICKGPRKEWVGANDRAAGLSRNVGANAKGRCKRDARRDNTIKEGFSIIFSFLILNLFFFFSFFSGQGRSVYLCRQKLRSQQENLKLQQTRNKGWSEALGRHLDQRKK